MTARVRTGYSFRRAFGRVPDVIQRLVDIGQTVAPITDTASTFGWCQWDKYARKAGLRPVFGVELAVTESVHAKKPIVDYWTFLTLDDIAPINHLVGIATEQFRYEPLLTLEQAATAYSVTAIMGHRTNLEAIEPHENLFFGLGPETSKGYMTQALALGHLPVAVSNNRYPADGQSPIYEVVCGRFASTQSYPQYILSDEEWIDRVSRIANNTIVGQALDNRQAVFDRSRAFLGRAALISPERAAPLRDLCRAGAERLGCDLSRPEYAARLDKELSLIAAKQFEDYFYIVADICQWARQRMIVGPARGSSCGSLVCYLLGITSVDPLPFGLIFERFIDVNRSDLPDIDIDFSEQYRDLVFDYVREKYGHERVARLGTVNMFQPKSALKEAAGALDVPQWELNAVTDSIVERSSGDARALQATEDTFKDTDAGRQFIAKYPEMMVAAAMEGHPHHAGQHAAGIVITADPIADIIAVDRRTGATMCNKKDAEALNLLKIDALGLTQLSIFEECLELANLPRDFLFSLPYDDPGAFEVVNARKYAGIFQFNGLALQSIADQIDVKDLNDIVAITALARPGPMNTGGTNHWIKVKNGAPETYPHPLFEPHLKNTLGVVAYQEQVMVIGREIGGLSWEDVTDLRKAMSKSLGKEFFDQYGDRWKAGARAKGIPEDTLTKVWDDLCAYGSWAFNLSHALAYGIISYWCLYLKAHYPIEYAAACLSFTDKPETQIKLLRELAAEGIDYVPVDRDYSTARWAVGSRDGKKILVGPLSNVNGIGPKMQASILSARARHEPIPERANKLLEGAKTKIDSLYPISDRVKEILPDPTVKNIFTPPTPLAKIQPDGTYQDVVVFVTPEQLKPRDENEEMTVIKRGKRITSGPTGYLNLRLADDTDVIFAKIDRFDFERLAQPMLERGRAGKALYCIKGSVPKNFRMISVKGVRYIGDMENEAN